VVKNLQVENIEKRAVEYAVTYTEGVIRNCANSTRLRLAREYVPDAK